MEVVIFAGGAGTRLSEETQLIPKPMVEIGGIPILVHIISYYAKFGYKDFIICGGYKVDYIKNYFSNLLRNLNDLELDFGGNKVSFLNSKKFDWKLKIIDTGLKTNTAGRLRKIKDLINEEEFMLTYGDGLSNIDLLKLKKFHLKNNNIVTLSGVFPPPRFGGLTISGNQIIGFTEKPKEEFSRVNGGFMICNKQVFEYTTNEQQSFEVDLLPLLANQKKLGCYKHDGFWQPMDTLRDKFFLEKIWNEGKALWKV